MRVRYGKKNEDKARQQEAQAHIADAQLWQPLEAHLNAVAGAPDWPSARAHVLAALKIIAGIQQKTMEAGGAKPAPAPTANEL